MIHFLQLFSFFLFLFLLEFIDNSIGFSVGFLVLEIPIVICVYFSLYLSLKNWRYRGLLAVIPIYVFYIFYNSFFLFFGRIFKLSDMSSTDELVAVIPTPYLLGLLFFVIFIVLVYCLAINYKNTKFGLFSIFPVLLLFVLVEMKPSFYMASFDFLLPGLKQWSDRDSSKANGYVAMLLYHEAKRLKALEELNDVYTPVIDKKYAESKAQFLRQVSNPQNIHIIILESYIDPSSFEKFIFSSSPIHPYIEGYFFGNLSTIISPVVGGNTSQAEFEALCGVPAFSQYSSIEFNLFTGSPVYCMPEILRTIGYRTVASHAFKPNFYNRGFAYTGVGFDEAYFPVDYSPAFETYLSLVDEDFFMFDGDFLNQNLNFVSKHIMENPEVPILNYVLGVYGHLPYERSEQHKLLIEVSDSSGADVPKTLIDIVNQTYYRTEALSEYLKELMEIDPDSLIIVFGDHVPGLGVGEYERFEYMGLTENYIYKTRGYFIESKVPVKYEGLPLFHIPDVIYNYLSKERYCNFFDCFKTKEGNRSQYMKLMAHAIQ